MTENEAAIHQLRLMIHQSSRGVVFTGAGISTESGIPDFRSPGGIWTKYQPIDFRDFMASEEMRRESWRRKIAADAVMKKARPNTGHLAIAKLVQIGKVSSVITQNIDGLHQLSGVPDEQVVELHGNATYAACLECGKRYELEAIYKTFQDNETLPECDECGGIIKTATISFGQAMPVKETREAEERARGCDLFIVIGSSLVVYPAAYMPVFALEAGAPLVIINREETPMDHSATVVVNAGAGDTLSAVMKRVQ